MCPLRVLIPAGLPNRHGIYGIPVSETTKTGERTGGHLSRPALQKMALRTSAL
jgi:hypothetical protein